MPVGDIFFLRMEFYLESINFFYCLMYCAWKHLFHLFDDINVCFYILQYVFYMFGA